MKKTALLIALVITLIAQTINYEEKLFDLQLHIGGDHGELEKADAFTQMAEETAQFYKEENTRLLEKIAGCEYGKNIWYEHYLDYQSIADSFLSLPQNQAELDWYTLNEFWEFYSGDILAEYLRERVAGLSPYEDDRCVGKFYSTGMGGLDLAVGRLMGENNPENDERLQQIYDIVFEGR